MFYFQLILLIICGGLIGYERQKTHKVIGIRSVILLMLGAFLFTHISSQIGGDPSRIAAQVVTGTGFLSAGIIWKEKATNISNLTTAIIVWITSSLGCIIAFKLFQEAIVSTILILAILKANFIKDNIK